MVGLPFAVIACTGPVIQRWYSWVGHRGDDPYFLFAASNLGSFVGLLAYPFLIEPQLSLASQRLAWSVGFAGYAALMVGCAVLTMRGPGGEPVAEEAPTPRPTTRTVLTWGLLAFVPSSLMLGVTAHLSTDVSPVPLLWVVPLAVYLATFVAAFARRSRTPPVWAAWVAVLLGGTALVLSGQTDRLWTVVAVNVALVAFAGYAAHGRLAAGRPAPDHLTLFYLVVAAGGAAGGLLNGLVAPVVLDTVLEYPVVLACLPLLLLGTAKPGARLFRRSQPVVLTALLLAFAVWTAQIVGAGSIERTRSFYGAYRVEARDGQHVLVHGNTVHGMQYQDEGRRRLPTTYYVGSGSAVDVFDVLRGRLDEVGVVGLGSGTLAAHGRSGERFTFVEIDPDIVATAQDPGLFTYLADSEAETRVIVGDGRAEVAADGPGHLRPPGPRRVQLGLDPGPPADPGGDAGVRRVAGAGRRPARPRQQPVLRPRAGPGGGGRRPGLVGHRRHQRREGPGGDGERLGGPHRRPGDPAAAAGRPVLAAARRQPPGPLDRRLLLGARRPRLTRPKLHADPPESFGRVSVG